MMKSKIIETSFKKFIQCFFLFCIGGLIYTTLETWWRGYTFDSMYILAGIVSILLMVLNDVVLDYDTEFFIQCLTGGIMCTFLEGITGLIVNRNFSQWDYRNLPFTFFWGQCNLLFVFVWIIISCFGIIFTDWYEWKIMKIGEKPYYRLKIFNMKKIYFY